MGGDEKRRLIKIRIWHKELIPYLPRKQLTGQWRELCIIAKAANEGTLNHIIVNRVKDYPIEHLYAYGILVFNEMYRRGFAVVFYTFSKYFDVSKLNGLPTEAEIFHRWHNHRYFAQCWHNLQEKYDCGGITEDEWRRVLDCGGDIE